MLLLEKNHAPPLLNLLFSWVTGCPGSSGKVHMAWHFVINSCHTSGQCLRSQQQVLSAAMMGAMIQAPAVWNSAGTLWISINGDSSSQLMVINGDWWWFIVIHGDSWCFYLQTWTIVGNLGNHCYNQQVQPHPLNVLQHQGQSMFHLSEMRSCRKQIEKPQILRTWLQKTAGVSNPNVVPCPPRTAASLTIKFQL